MISAVQCTQLKYVTSNSYCTLIENNKLTSKGLRAYMLYSPRLLYVMSAKGFMEGAHRALFRLFVFRLLIITVSV